MNSRPPFPIKSRRHYMTTGAPTLGVPAEKVYVTGFEWVPFWKREGGEWWCRVKFAGDRVSSMICHPTSLVSCAG